MAIIRNGPLPNDPSKEAPERVRKTHKDPETISCLTKLPIDSKLKMNYEKQLRNATHREHIIGGAETYQMCPRTFPYPKKSMRRCYMYADRGISWIADYKSAG
ncbi:hypothetical protein GGU10DRAFT_337406 [Lentinula aff. detonsa]|uniref:Uncharacterized protein n=1 Tax=Lentinula aff. detonsa TaxID=2804958 RepID=A0AA38NHB6_9AGAR|nr:hypothetical protein GGU10DRAFT_337406 [Lentinula aff. detonsa]